MKIAIVHDYLSEYGGAERVLRALSDMYPDAPIYTAFMVHGSSAARAFKNRKIIQSWFRYVPFYRYLYSPLRFLIPWIWGSFNFSGFDLIITSASWYVTKGLAPIGGPLEICYCHTPPRWLYGYPTSVNFQKYWPVRWYGIIVGYFLRMYDFKQAQKVDVFVANSQEVARRIKKFYRREAIVIYPPVEIPNPKSQVSNKLQVTNHNEQYYLVLSRMVGGKGVELAVKAAAQKGFKLKVAGEAAGFGGLKNVETLGYVSEAEKARLMAEAKGFLALEEAADFGITPVESMLCGTPVIAYNGGGYRETVVDGKTGVLFDDYSVEGLISVMDRFNKLKWNRKLIQHQAKRFSRHVFVDKMTGLVKALKT